MEIGASFSGAKATDFFGSPSTDSVFSAGQSTPATDTQESARVIINSHKREINRIRGYKLQLSPAENQRLSEIQAEIIEIETKATQGLAREDELEDRLELLAEADEIIGKPTANVGDDEAKSDELAEQAGILQALLEPKLSPALQKRVEQLERVKESLETSLSINPESATLLAQFQNVSGQIDTLKPPRPISQLSLSERKDYDDLADLINQTAGAEIQLSSRDAIRVAELEGSIIDLQATLPPDISQQPTPGDVARAYTRIG